MQYLLEILAGIIALVSGILLGAYAIGYRKKITEKDFEDQEKNILNKAEEFSEKLKEEARNKINIIKKQAQENNTRLEAQLKRLSESLVLKEKQLERKGLRNKELEERVLSEYSEINNLKEVVQGLLVQAEEKLIRIAKTSIDVLTKKILSENEYDLKKETKEKVDTLGKRIVDEAPRRAKEIIRYAIHNYSAETSMDRRKRTVYVAHDENKLQIVGIKGENIKLLEELLPNVNIVFNDGPDTITVYSFDLIQENITRLALENLVQERVVTAEKIKNAIKKAESEMPKIFEKIGRDANEKIGLVNPAPELLTLIGRLYFRTSYGQNILKHSFEVASLARSIAYELGGDTDTAWIAAFFHDIGKAIDKEYEGVGHDQLTKEILEKFGFSKEIVHAAWVHHEAAEAETIEARIVQAADAISASRPGARSESLEQYLERIKLLEETASSFSGISKVYSMSSGREVRLFVNPEVIKDENVAPLAGKVARKIESELTYPGVIRISVIRKTHLTEVANREESFNSNNK